MYVCVDSRGNAEVQPDERRNKGTCKSPLSFLPMCQQKNFSRMKNLIPALSVVALLGMAHTTQNNGNATVSKIQGVSIYIYSQPSESYQVIDSGKILVTISGSCNDSINQAAKKAGKAGADGLIFHPDSERWEAIKFN